MAPGVQPPRCISACSCAHGQGHNEFRAAAATVLGECGDSGWALWKNLEPLLEEVRAARVTLRTALARSVIEADGYPL